MSIFAPLEKLINEHASAKVLIEHLSLAKAQADAVRSERDALAEQLRAGEAKIECDRVAIEALKRELARAKSLTAKIVCDHCGSPDLKRTGSTPNPMMGKGGVKDMIFSCNECAKVSQITPDP